MLKKVLVTLTILAVSTLYLTVDSQSSSFSSHDYAITINLAGRQRMLTQKMSKEILFIAKGFEAGKYRNTLKKTADLFDSTLDGLINGNKRLKATNNKEIQAQLRKVKTLWKSFYSIIETVVEGGKPDVEKIARLNMPLLKNMNTAVQMYTKEAKQVTGKAAGKVINLAGKQRMLTQKMSKEMLLAALGYDTANSVAELKKTADLFDKTLKGLRNGDKELGLPATSAAGIVVQLDEVASIWRDFKAVVEKVTAAGAADDGDIKKMSELNIPLLKSMNKAVMMYEKVEH